MVNHPNRSKAEANETNVRELRLFIDNDGELYRQQTLPIIKNLCQRMAKGTYDAAKAPKLWGYLADTGAQRYHAEFGSKDFAWHKMFSTADRRAVAEELARHFETEYKLGAYANIAA